MKKGKTKGSALDRAVVFNVTEDAFGYSSAAVADVNHIRPEGNSGQRKIIDKKMLSGKAEVIKKRNLKSISGSAINHGENLNCQ